MVRLLILLFPRYSTPSSLISLIGSLIFRDLPLISRDPADDDGLLPSRSYPRSHAPTVRPGLSTYQGSKWKGHTLRLEAAKRPDYEQRMREERARWSVEEERLREKAQLLARKPNYRSKVLLARDMSLVTDKNCRERTVGTPTCHGPA